MVVIDGNGNGNGNGPQHNYCLPNTEHSTVSDCMIVLDTIMGKLEES